MCLATSVDVERVFSKGRLLLPHVRNRLSVNTIRALLCLGDWSKKGYIHEADIKAAAKLPDIRDGDEQEDSDVL